MNRRSAFLKVALGFAVVYAAYSACFFVFYVDQAYERMTKRSFEQASNYLKMGRVLLKNGEVVDLAERLAAGLAAHDFGYYLIKQNGETLAYGNAAGSDDPVHFVENGPEGIYETDTYRHFVLKEKGYELAVGYKTSRLAYVQRFYEIDRDLILKDIGFVSLLTIALVIFNFRDILMIVARLRTRNIRRGDEKVAKSAEALALVRGIRAFESQVESLAKDNERLKAQVLPALQKELWSGRTPPYEFGCTLVRTDINNFTTLFMKEDRAEFMGVINEFFVGVTHIVSRYKGYVYEFIGDEVLFYFKDEEHANSAAIAISALRDINKLADRLHARTQVECGYAFRIKSSLACGVLRFGPLVDGFGLAGNPLIETVRMLSHVHEKAENVALLDDAVRERIAFLCQVQDLKVVMLKGLEGARKLHVYQAHVPLNHHLRQMTEESWANATFYRSDEDLAELLHFIRLNYQALSREQMLYLLSLPKGFKVTRPSVDVRNAYLDLLEDLVRDSKQIPPDEKANVGLATLVTTGGHLLTSNGFTGRVRERLLECLELEDRRIVANTIDLFAELDPGADEQVFASLAKHVDNRISANTLVMSAKNHWDRKVARRLRALLKAQSPYYKASGLYALGEIGMYFRKSDEVAFRADRELQKLIDEGLRLVIHPNRMVRRQALRAIVKTDRLNDLRGFAITHSASLTNEIRHEIQAVLEPTVEGESAKRKLRAVG